jgi:hypothetical protein
MINADSAGISLGAGGAHPHFPATSATDDESGDIPHSREAKTHLGFSAVVTNSSIIAFSSA